jgi:hypothetical protein
MTTQSTVPSNYDIDYILSKMTANGIMNHYGHSSTENGWLIVYRAEDFDTVQTILDNYQTSYAEEVLKPKMLADVAALRWNKQQVFKLNDSPMKSDPETISSITAAVVLMDVNPTSPQTRRWKVGPNTWANLSRTDLIGIGTAAADHVQACFEREEELALLISQATTVDDLMEIDVTSGWSAE